MRALVMLYGVVCYFAFFVVFVYFMGFVGDVFVPVSISSEVETYSQNALMINIGLMLMWGVQHSVMARGWFKDMIASVVPHHVERSTYCLASAIALGALMYYWQPMEGIIWQVENAMMANVLWGFFGLGWALIFLSTFLTDHFDLFGLRQPWLHFVKKTYTPVVFTEVLFYRWIRHPMMLGLFIAFWSLPTMTVGHLVFSIGMSIYVLAGIHFEERGLARELGQTYVDYQKRTSKVIPKVY
jgi:protein-S-isoprenylcysteine O-methyltransferase Ste14